MTIKYTEDHEWIKSEGDSFKIGITEYAQEQLGDVVVVEMPEVDRAYQSGETCAVIESVKAASDIFSPIEGTITSINTKVVDNPELVNSDPEGDGWLWEMTSAAPQSLDDLMDKQAYEQFLQTVD